MSAGWVLLQTDRPEAAPILAALTEMPGVEFAEQTVGAYDVVARVADAGPDVRSAKRVTQAALRIPGVTLAVCCHDGDGRGPETVDLTGSGSPVLQPAT